MVHAAVVAVFWLIGVVTGPTLGFALIFTDISLYLINAIGALVFALLAPYIAIGRTLLYFDLQLQAEEEPAKHWRTATEACDAGEHRSATGALATAPAPAESRRPGKGRTRPKTPR